ncbi:MAG: hypothetical protein ACE5KM_18590 [Planctomycetaceae bacterium]
MSPQSSDRKPSPDIYVGLLFVSAAALITGCIFLVMELDTYLWTMAK